MYVTLTCVHEGGVTDEQNLYHCDPWGITKNKHKAYTSPLAVSVRSHICKASRMEEENRESKETQKKIGAQLGIEPRTF